MGFSKSTLKFSVAESDFYFKEMLINRLLNHFRLRLANNCNNGHELITQLYKRQEDVILIDLYMPVLSGMETLKFAKQLKPDIAIIVYGTTFQEDVAFVASSYKNVFYCCKKADVIEFVLLNCVLSNNKSYDDYIFEWKAEPTIVHQIQQQQRQGWYEPSVLEIQLMRLCYEGLSSKEIGTYLNLSTRTIDTYITRLAQKLGLRNKIDLIRFAVENGYYNTNI